MNQNHNHNALLTIAIPTYNRPESIKRQVLFLLPHLTEEVNLIIVDNHSDKEVKELFYNVPLPENVYIVRNKFNIGGDANIAKCFELCDTPWLWTLSDDDLLDENAVEIVLNNIRSNSNASFINFNRKIALNGSGIRVFIDNALSQYSYLFWMSVCVYNVDVLIQHMNDYFSSISCMQPGVLLILKSLSVNKNQAFVFSKEKIVIEGNKAISWNRERFIYSSLFFTDILKISLPEHYDKVSRAIMIMCFNAVVTQYRMEKNINKAFRLCNVVYCRMRRLKTLFFDFYYYFFTQLRLLKSGIVK